MNKSKMPPPPSHTPSSNYSSDSKGDSNAAKTGKPTRQRGPYVYYRLYTQLGAIESNHPIYSDDRLIGRIPSKSFPPPRTVASIKQYLCECEGLPDPDKSHIFVPLSSPTPRRDSTRLSLFAPSRPGLSEQDPIALVVDSEERTTSVVPSKRLPKRSVDKADIRYVHYCVYSTEGEEKSKTSFDESNVSLGRINTLLVAPPHTVGSLKACIAKVEGLVTPDHALYNEMELFEDLNNDAAMSDTDVLSFLGDTYPGSEKGDPIALVNARVNIPADQESAPVLQGKSTAKIRDTRAAAGSTSSDPTFTKRARTTQAYNAKNLNIPNWLSITRGQIVRTDGILVSRRCPIGGYSYEGYIAINSAGHRGFVSMSDLEFI